MQDSQVAILQAECERLQAQVAELTRFQRIVEDTDQLVTEVDSNGIFTYVNPAAERFFGYPPQDCIGRSSLEFLHPDDRERAQRALGEWVQRGERTVTVENRVVHRSGAIFPILWTIAIRYDNQRQFAGATSIAHDISHIQRLRHELAESRSMLRLIIDSLPQAVFWKDRDGRFLGCNQQLLRYAGLSSEAEIVGKTDFEMPWRDQADAYRADDLEVMRSGPKLNIEEPLTRSDGTTIWLRTNKLPLQRDGEVIGVLGMYEDVTDIKLQAEELRTFKLLVENAPDGIAIADPHLVITYNNPALAKMLQYPSLVGKAVAEIVYPADLPILEQIAQQVMQGLTPRETVRYVRSDGALITIQASALALRDEHGNLTGYASINRDITEQLQAEENLRLSERRKRALLDAIPDLMFLLRPDGVFLDYKADYSGKLLMPPEAFLGKRVDEVLAPPLAAQLLHHMDQLKRTNEMQQFDYQLIIDDQTLEYEARMVFSDRDILILSRNVTEQRRIERERTEMQEQIIAAQQATLRELSTPLMPIADGVIAMPLIGAIDTMRAQQIMETLLNGVAEYRAQVAIIDITGVKVVDTQVAGALVRAAQAARMLGAQVVLTGISPEIAQTLVHIGTELRDMTTRATLQEGIDYALKRRGTAPHVMGNNRQSRPR